MSFTLEEFLKLKAEKERMDSELRMASQLQQNMMPKGYVIKDNVELYGKLVPAREMGGDLFDYYIRDEKLFFCIGDVCGKGAPAAMLMAYAHAYLGTFTLKEDNPAHIIYSLNQIASDGNDSCTFITLFFGVLHLSTGLLQYCNAGHNPPYILDSEVTMLDCHPNQPVGPMSDVEFILQEITLRPGSTIFLYTDGLTEAQDKERLEFGVERTENALRDCLDRRLNPEEIVDTVTETVHHFTMKAEQSDDMTMLAIRYTPDK